MENFEKNISSLKKINSTLSRKISDIKDVKTFEIFMDEGDISSLNFIHKKHFIPLYEGNPSETVDEMTKNFKALEEYPYLYMYGLGNGVLLQRLLENPKLKRIVIIEPEIEIAHIVFHMLDFSDAITRGRLVLIDDLDFPLAAKLFDTFEVQRYARVYELQIASSYYEKLYEVEMLQTNKILIAALEHWMQIAGNDTTDSLIGLKHHIFNMPTLLNTPSLQELLKKLRGASTCVLVSMGPSLTKQLPLLKKIVPHVRIIAVDAAFPVLYEAGIKPDVVVSIERVKQSAKFFEAVPEDGFNDVVFGLSSLQHRDVIEGIKGGTIQMSIRPLEYMMYMGPESWGYMGIGMSAANMAYELIFHSRCKTCILIGQDLAYGTKGESHASGHVFGQKNVKKDEQEVQVTAWGGKGEVTSSRTWDMFRKSFEKDISETKLVEMRTVNATEGGAHIYGTEEISFNEAVKRYVNTTQRKEPLVLHKVVQKELHRITQETHEKIEKITAYIKSLSKKTEKVFLKVATACDGGIKNEVQLQQLLKQIESVKIHCKDEIYKKVVWDIAQSTMLPQEIAIAPIEVKLARDKDSKKAKQLELLYAYKAWLFSLAGILDAILKTIAYAKERTLIHSVEQIRVEIDGKVIDTFTCKELKPQKGRVFDVDMRGILYDVPDEYQNRIEEVVFKDNLNNEKLPKSFVSVIKKTDEKYNELSFMRSLDNVDDEKIKDLYCKNTIGFLATEENLEDEEFVRYINQIMHDFPSYTFKALYFDANLTKKIKKKFKNDNLVLLELSNIYDIFENLEVYLSNNDRNKVDILIVVQLRKYLSNIFSLSLNLNMKSVTLENHEKNNSFYFKKFFNNLKYLGFKDADIKKYGSSFHEIYFKKLSETYDVNINFDLEDSVNKAYIYYNLKLGQDNHNFFKESQIFAKKFAKL